MIEIECLFIFEFTWAFFMFFMRLKMHKLLGRIIELMVCFTENMGNALKRYMCTGTQLFGSREHLYGAKGLTRRR